MESYFLAISTGLGNVLSFPNILIPVLGTAIAMVGAFLPGIGNSSLTAIVLVATLTWDPVSVLLLFGALTGGATFMGSITGILFNVPGNASSAAVLLDGHPMARNGRARTAIACAATASATGSLFGVLVLLVILPFVQPLLLEFGPLERLLLGVWGLSTIIAIPNLSPLRALAVTMLGLLCAMIGSDPTSGLSRWTFGSLQLSDGFGTIAVLLGFLTLSEVIGWRQSYQVSSSGTDPASGSTKEGIKSVFAHPGLTARSSIIGTLVGVIPGVGGTVASFVAYGQAVQWSDKPETFGTGDIRGVIAPEAAVDSKDGGSLLPVLAFGLPGSEGGVILITVLAIHGLVPGTPMLTHDLPLSLTLIFALLMSNILTSIVGVSLSPYLAKLTRLRIDRIALPALIASLVTIVQLNGLLTDLYVAAAFGLLGYLFKRLDWPRVPFIIAFILGSFIETNYALTVRLMDVGRISVWERPAAIVIIGLILATLAWMLLGRRKTTKQAFRTKSRGDRLVAFGLTAIALAMALAPTYDGGVYSPYALSMAWMAALSCGIVAVTGLLAQKSAFVERTIPNEHRLSVGLLTVLPAAVWALGVSTAIALLTFFWLRFSADLMRIGTVWILVVSGSVLLAIHLLIENVARLRLPEPGILTILQSFLGG